MQDEDTTEHILLHCSFARSRRLAHMFPGLHRKRLGGCGKMTGGFLTPCNPDLLVVLEETHGPSAMLGYNFQCKCWHLGFWSPNYGR
jgi:hypothetical protein